MFSDWLRLARLHYEQYVSANPWGCPLCDQGNESKSRFLEHMQDVHEMCRVLPLSRHKIQCEVCRRSQDVQDLMQHFTAEYGDPQSGQSTLSTQSLQESSHIPNLPDPGLASQVTPQQGIPSEASLTGKVFRPQIMGHSKHICH